MTTSFPRQMSLGAVATLIATAGVIAGSAQSTTIRLDSARVVVNGTSNVHAWTAATTTARIARVELAADGEASLFDVLANPGVLRAFEVVVPAASLTSPKDGLDKNMHKALKVHEHADITFRLARLETTAAGPFRAAGTLKIAGVERDVTLDVTATRTAAAAVTLKGSVDLLMTDYGVTPPKAMLGMLKTDPKVTVQFEAVLSTPQS